MTPFPSWQDTFLALHRAATLEELWTVLLGPHGIRSSSAWEEPFALFRRFHADDSEHAATTAALLCTDHRWRKGNNRLIEHSPDPKYSTMLLVISFGLVPRRCARGVSTPPVVPRVPPGGAVGDAGPTGCDVAAHRCRPKQGR